MTAGTEDRPWGTEGPWAGVASGGVRVLAFDLPGTLAISVRDGVRGGGAGGGLPSITVIYGCTASMPCDPEATGPE